VIDAILPARAIRIGLISIALFSSTACTRPTAAMTKQALRGRGAVVEVRNDNFDDCVIYLIRGGTPIPLGVTPGLSRRTFGVRQGQLGDGGAVVLGSGKRGGPIQHITASFDFPPGRIATWIVRYGDRTEQPLLR
jgi:hypothetical protein